MEIILLGKKLEDYPDTSSYEEKLIENKFDEHNLRVIRARLNKNFVGGILNHVVMDNNKLKPTKEIVAATRVFKSKNILTESEWGSAIYVIERGLKANKAYVRLLDDISPTFERYFKDFEDVNMRETFLTRINLEFWQGRFNEEHWCNPNHMPNFS